MLEPFFFITLFDCLSNVITLGLTSNTTQSHESNLKQNTEL